MCWFTELFVTFPSVRGVITSVRSYLYYKHPLRSCLVLVKA